MSTLKCINAFDLNSQHKMLFVVLGMYIYNLWNLLFKSNNRQNADKFVQPLNHCEFKNTPSL